MIPTEFGEVGKGSSRTYSERRLQLLSRVKMFSTGIRPLAFAVAKWPNIRLWGALKWTSSSDREVQYFDKKKRPSIVNLGEGLPHLGPPRISVSSLRKDEASCATSASARSKEQVFASHGVWISRVVRLLRERRGSMVVFETPQGLLVLMRRTRDVFCPPEVRRAETNRCVKSGEGIKPSAQVIDRYLRPALISFNSSSQPKLSSTWA